LHKPSGQAVCTVPCPGRPRGRDDYLGPYDSPESKRGYERILAQLRAGGPAPVPVLPARAADLTVNEVLLAYLRYTDGYYRHPDGTPTGEAKYVRGALTFVKKLYGHTLAREFGPAALKAVR
jgi:hypothetical protein